MFSKSLFVFFMAACLVQPNEAIFGLDGIIIPLIKEANSVAQNGSLQALILLTGLQTTIQNATNFLNTQIVTVVNNAIRAGVTTAGGSQSKIANCTALSRGAITAFEISSLNEIVNTCVTGSVSQTISIIVGISGSANNITNIVLNANNTIATACPKPASGDLLGGVANGACVLATGTRISGEVAVQGAIIAANIAQASALVTSLSTFTATIPTCVSAQLTSIALKAVPVITPVIQCTLLP